MCQLMLSEVCIHRLDASYTLLLLNAHVIAFRLWLKQHQLISKHSVSCINMEAITLICQEPCHTVYGYSTSVYARSCHCVAICLRSWHIDSVGANTIRKRHVELLSPSLSYIQPHVTWCSGCVCAHAQRFNLKWIAEQITIVLYASFALQQRTTATSV